MVTMPTRPGSRIRSSLDRRAKHAATTGQTSSLAFAADAPKISIVRLRKVTSLPLWCTWRARHTFGTVAMAETRDPGQVREVMGHESLTTTLGYLHPGTAAIKAVIDRRNQQKLKGTAIQEEGPEPGIEEKYVM